MVCLQNEVKFHNKACQTVRTSSHGDVSSNNNDVLDHISNCKMTKCKVKLLKAELSHVTSLPSSGIDVSSRSPHSLKG